MNQVKSIRSDNTIFKKSKREYKKAIDRLQIEVTEFNKRIEIKHLIDGYERILKINKENSKEQKGPQVNHPNEEINKIEISYEEKKKKIENLELEILKMGDEYIKLKEAVEIIGKDILATVYYDINERKKSFN
jgi:predicted RNase H-like nuclease (RuvC/YqgF family)